MYPGKPLREGISPLEDENSRTASQYAVISVKITRTFISHSYARYSAAVNAQRGVIILSRIGSSDKLINIHTLSITPVSSKERLNVSATSFLTPIAPNTIQKFSASCPVNDACLTIWLASLSCGKPEPEKIGNFCPRIKVFNPSIADIPVLM